MPSNNSWNNAIAAAKSAITLNAGTNNVNISSDASATTVNIATGAAAKTVTLGSSSGASSLALKCGTSDFSLASATGTIINALDTGEITYPLQPAFLAISSSAQSNITGDGTLATAVCANEIFDQNNDFDGTSTFTAPVTGRYQLNAGLYITGLSGSFTRGACTLTTSNRDYYLFDLEIGNVYYVTGALYRFTSSVLADMDAGDTYQLKFLVSGSTKTVGLGSVNTYMSGSLIC